MRLAFCLLLATAALCLAQEGGGRLIFPPGAKEPVTTPTPTPSPGRKENPAETIDMFFLSLKASQVDAAYDALVKNTIIAEREQDVAALKERTKQALDNYGPISGYELVDEKVVGTCLLRRTCISLNSDLPLRWRFYFYKANTWRLVDLRVDDGLVELFEEAGRARKQ